MKKLFTIAMLLGVTLGIHAQEVYSLQKCRELALQNNRQLKVSRMTVDVAENIFCKSSFFILINKER